MPPTLDRHIVPILFNDPANLSETATQHARDLAAIIVDPCVDTLASKPFLRAAREVADRYGAVLIFDEIISGFRIARGGIQEIHGVRPDLICLGKSVANGMPLSLVTGTRAVMSEFSRIWYGLTFEQETVSMAAGRACLSAIERLDAPKLIGSVGDELRSAYAALAQEIGIRTELIGPPQRLMPRFYDSQDFGPRTDQALRFVETLIGQRVLLCNAINLSLAHDERAVVWLVDAFRAALEQAARPIGAQAARPAHFHHKADIAPAVREIASTPGAPVRIRCRVRNTGQTVWRISGAGIGKVNLGLRLYDERRSVIDQNFRRHDLAAARWRGPAGRSRGFVNGSWLQTALSARPAAWIRNMRLGRQSAAITRPVAANQDPPDVQVGEELDLDFEIPAPSDVGHYLLEIDCVEEGVTWLKDVGSLAPTIALRVDDVSDGSGQCARLPRARPRRTTSSNHRHRSARMWN
ncbi:aminotransferase class III-fold pyridoxal phosphate-dependent enzyme [Methylobacterium planeticum]|uniref:Aminotransferase class III-fold pyridoxal phosphate-dependent enzyme n=1 Tax=Methylobacterium planeticum TaxID=2615211 RepID=A0A6N6MUY2_9HYPH|nr:aminotransferase class III-fold pyridoxal phosphate-dependent enzyme [Methylobacterium planeticum]